MIVVTLARKPLAGTVATTASKYGTGGINIDACRISAGDEKIGDGSKSLVAWRRMNGRTDLPVKPPVAREPGVGRWPANLLLQHLDGCQKTGTVEVPGYVINRWDDGAKPFGGGAGHEFTTSHIPSQLMDVWDCQPGCPVAELDRQSGVIPGCRRDEDFHSESLHTEGWGSIQQHRGPRGYADTGGAARYFHQVQAEEWEQK